MTRQLTMDYAPSALQSRSTFHEVAVDLLRCMLMAREGDRREGVLMRQGKGWFQLPGMGHEAIAALGYLLTPDDYIFPSYRARALMHVRGIEVEQMARDFLARTGSSSEGRNLPGHVSSRKRNVFSVTSPVGAQCLPAVGAAIGIQREQRPHVVLCHLGDATTRQGEFYEAVCLAVQEQLPVVFVVEDNHYGISTPTQGLTPYRLEVLDRNLITPVNGRDAEAVYAMGHDAIARARRGDGPSILWCDVDRLSSHTHADDHRTYRSASELQEMDARDPIDLLANRLMASGLLTASALEAMKQQVCDEVRTVYERVEQEASPSAAQITTHLYGPPVACPPIPSSFSISPPKLLHAVNQALRLGLDSDPRILLFGEDIEDPKGGVFGLTRGLSTQFPGRVVNAPLAEATILGTAVGLAATGYRPVFELQFIDFMTPAFNQLVGQITNLRWRSHGEWTCPLVLYAPYGAYLPAGGMWHSQSNEGWWAHMPGLRVAVPSTPQDAIGLFWTAFHEEDPTLILLPKHLFHARSPEVACEPIPFGKARLVREGDEVTVVTWGNCVELAVEAAGQLAVQGLSVEILDLRTITPCDWETIAVSLAKTGRLVVVQEDMRTCGFGQAIISEMASHADRFYTLAAPPRLVARPDVYIPFCPELERAILPDVDDVVAAVRETME